MKIQRAAADSGFSRTDLLTVIAVSGCLAILPMKAISKPRDISKSVQCSRNLEQLTKAWSLHAQDNDGRLLSSGTQTLENRTHWVTGIIDFRTIPQDWHAPIRASPLMPYLNKNVEGWRCPADLSKVRDTSGKAVPRPRSYSMNDAFGYGGWLPLAQWRTYDQIQSIVNPSKTFVLMDEHPDSLNDGALAVQMVTPHATAAQIIDFPSSLHDGAAAISFADGHVEFHKWRGKRIRPTVKYASMPLNVPAGDSLQDIKWLSERTTVSIRSGTWE